MAFLEITLQIAPANRPKAVGVYNKYRQAFLENVPGAQTKSLLVRDADCQVLHGFETAADASQYLASELFTSDVVGELAPLLAAEPEVRIYDEVA
jgi:hypothetical protein